MTHTKRRSFWRALTASEGWARFKRSKLALIGAAIVLLVTAVALVGPFWVVQNAKSYSCNVY